MPKVLRIIVAFDAAPFQSDEDPLRFRGIPDSLAQYHVEASEVCTVEILAFPLCTLFCYSRHVIE